MSELENLRKEMIVITKKILRLGHERMMIARRIGEVKRKMGLEIVDEKAEERLINECMKECRSLGLSEEFCKKLIRLLINESIRVQRATYEKEITKRSLQGAKMKIAVIGAGAMGEWLAKHFIDKRFTVKIYDIVAEKAEKLREIGAAPCRKLDEALREVDAAIIAVPIRETSKLVEKAANLMKHGILMEISSLKLPIIESMKRLPEGITPISIHPLFGPRTKDLKGEKIVLIPLRSPDQELEIVKRFFEGAELLALTAEEHDRLMAYILSLTHILSLAAAISIEEDLEKLLKYSGKSFKLLAQMMNSTLEESSELFSQIIIMNKFSIKPILNIFDELEKILNAIKSKDEESIKLLHAKALSKID